MDLFCSWWSCVFLKHLGWTCKSVSQILSVSDIVRPKYFVLFTISISSLSILMPIWEILLYCLSLPIKMYSHLTTIRVYFASPWLSLTPCLGMLEVVEDFHCWRRYLCHRQTYWGRMLIGNFQNHSYTEWVEEAPSMTLVECWMSKVTYCFFELFQLCSNIFCGWWEMM